MATKRYNTSGKLKDEHRAFLVRRLAMYDSPKEAAEALNSEYGIHVSPQATERYDPTKRAGQNLADRWRVMFEQTRHDFLNNIERFVPEANKVVRVSQLAHAARAFKGRGNFVAMKDMLEAIAKEMGNVHTNRRELTGRDGKPVQIEHADMTDEQLNARLAQLIGAGVALGEGDGSGGD